MFLTLRALIFYKVELSWSKTQSLCTEFSRNLYPRSLRYNSQLPHGIQFPLFQTKCQILYRTSELFLCYGVINVV